MILDSPHDLTSLIQDHHQISWRDHNQDRPEDLGPPEVRSIFLKGVPLEIEMSKLRKWFIIKS